MKKIIIISLHAGYWTIYLLLILLFDMLISLMHHPVFTWHSFLYVFRHNPTGIFLIVPAVIPFYVFYTLLFSRFLKKKRLWLLLSSATGTCVCAAVLTGFLVRLLFGLNFVSSADNFRLFIIAGVIAMVNGILGLVMKGFIEWYGEIRLKEELNRKNNEMELALIKSQISPHFLFNTLNNIDVLIEKDAVLASGYLNKLSDILRFMLYETKTEQIPLAKELSYIEKYIELQRIRTSNPQAIQYSVQGQTGQLMIEPMLFIPFIENAFKHAEKRVDKAIRIRFVLEPERIIFDCQNRYDAIAPDNAGNQDNAGNRSNPDNRSNPNNPRNRDKPNNPEGHGGLGNSLIRKRLLLLYPDRHTLDIEMGNELYKATLTINAHGN
jgi:two-component system, LytTR family, sensor kinase